MAAKIVVVGSANTDMVVRVDEIPHLGETVIGGEFIRAQGGKGANQAVAAARLGAEVTFVTCLGRDEFGLSSATAYQVEGINTQFIKWDDAIPSGVALIMVNRSGENIIAVAPGANSRLTSFDIYKAEASFRNASVVLLQLEIPLESVITAIELAKKYQAKVILNPAPAMPLPDKIMRSVDVLTPNEHELGILAGTDLGKDLSRGRDYANRAGIKSLIVTIGAEGALVFTEHTACHVPGFQVNVIDTVAAGDAFNGALAVALSKGDSLLDSVRYANAVGGISVTRVGAQPSLPTQEEVVSFMEARGKK